LSRFAEEAIEGGKAQEVRKLLESDRYLFENIVQFIRSGQDALSALSCASTVLTRLREALQMSPYVPLSSVWTRAVSGDVIGSPLLRETMLLVKKIPSDKLMQLLAYMQDFDDSSFTMNLNVHQSTLQDLVKTNANSTPLRSQHDVRNDSLRTTVVAQKVLLSKHKAALSEHDKAYSELVARIHDDIDNYLTTAFIKPGSLPLSEILIYDLKSPHTEVFQPKPRFAIERALASPHDYLGCECCGGEAAENGEVSLSGTQPSTAILYQMYLESGALINVSDLWSAFNAIAGDEGDESEAKTMQVLHHTCSHTRL
jgi:origin recognition complex subunit 3